MSLNLPSLPPLMIDGHADTVQRFMDGSWNFDDPLADGMLNLETARAGGLGAEFFAIWVDPAEYPGRFRERTLELIDAVHAQVRRCPHELARCVSAAEIEAAHREEKFGVLLGLEGGHSIEGNLDHLRAYYQLGVRYMTLTWSHSVGWADSCGDVDDHTVAHVRGLSAFGRDVIHEMNRLGMMVDVSHVSDDTFWAVLDASQAPIIASHSSSRAITQAPRNLTDEQLRAIARSGGIAMVNFFPAFLDEGWRHAWDQQKAARDLAHEHAAQPYRAQQRPVPFAVSNAIDRHFAKQLPAVPFTAVVDHLEHMIAVAGAEHVGIGSDFDGIPAAPSGLASAADLPKLTEALAARGHSEASIDGVLGGNLLRVFRAVEAAARP